LLTVQDRDIVAMED